MTIIKISVLRKHITMAQADNWLNLPISENCPAARAIKEFFNTTDCIVGYMQTCIKGFWYNIKEGTEDIIEYTHKKTIFPYVLVLEPVYEYEI